MRQQFRWLTSLLVLCATALCWVGCNRQGGYNDACCYVEPNYPESYAGSYQESYPESYQESYAESYSGSYPESNVREYAPVCRPSCPTSCEPTCRPSCPEPCEPACKPSCPAPCEPVCKASCPAPCEPVCKPSCSTPCKPVCRPAAAPPCDCRPAIQCKHPNTNECCYDGVIVRVKQPKLCILGDTYALDVLVEACEDVCDVVVKANLPDGVSVVRSEPAGVTTEGQRAVWHIDGMSKGEIQTSRVFLRADREGDLCVCFCVTAVPVRFCSLLCAKPLLTCDKCGPEEVCPGDPIHYTVRVSNRGSCPAEEVVVTDLVPPEVEHSSGLRTLTFKLGTIQPCETKTLNICMTAVKRGKACNTVNVTSCNANQTSCQWCTNICKQCIELEKTGPKEVPIGKTAEYTITVTNPGDKSLTDVIVTDNAPTPTSIVEARGAQVNGNQAVWRFRELKPGERQTMTLVLTTCTPGYFCNKVSVTNCQGCTANAEACTRWKGRPALNICVDQAENPLCVGEPGVYAIRVTNQGSEEDTNIVVVARFPEEMQPVAGSGASQGNVNGQTVTFTPYPRIGPRQTIEYRLDAKAKKSGDGRVKVEVSSDSIRTPIVQEESTIVN